MSHYNMVTWGGRGFVKKNKKNKKYDMNIDIDNMSVFPHHNH